MKTTLRLLPAFAAMLMATAFAGENIDFQVEKKRSGMERSKNFSTQTSQEKWGYHVTLVNQSFKPLAGVEIRYVFFAKSEVLGSETGKSKEGKKSGTQKIDMFKSNSKFEFDTEAVDLKKSELIGGYYYPSGAKPKANATLEGIWIRIYQNGTVIAEFSQPDDVKTKKKWE